MKPASVLFPLSIAACSSQAVEATKVEGLIRYATLHSAFDGEHDYRVVLTVLRDDIPMDDPDSRVDWTSVRWATDPAFVEQVDYPDLAGAALLTTRRVGTTRIALSFETTEGARYQSDATLDISAASSDEWSAGDLYFRGPDAPIGPPPPESVGVCGLPVTVELPATRGCLNCHHTGLGAIGGSTTPLDLAMYPDDELIATFANGALPRGGLDAQRGFGRDERGACVFAYLHDRDDLDERTARGVLWKLRSLEPVIPDDFDPELLNHVERDFAFP